MVRLNDFLDFSKVKVLVFGDLVLDRYLRGNVSRISPEAPVPVLLIKDEYECLGGAGNVIENIVSLGSKVRVLGQIGNDDKGHTIKRRMDEIGADTKYMDISDTVKTIVKTRLSAQNQQLIRFDEETINPISSEMMEIIDTKAESLLSGIDIVIISDYGKGMITNQSAQLLISKAKERNIPVIVDPKGMDYSKYRGATACTPNMKEFSEAIGTTVGSEDDIKEKGLELAKSLKMDYLVITRSEKGLSLIDQRKGDKKDFPAKAKEVVDVTGAGDTVIATFAIAFAKGYSMDDCCRLSNLTASIVVSKFGAATSTIDEISSLIEPHRDNKTVSIDEVVQWADSIHAAKKKIVFTNGCFDIVHAGHIKSFEMAKEMGDVLIVGLNSDESIRRIKGPKRPIISEENRARLLESIAVIDKVVVFSEDSPESLIQKIRPDVLVKGSDWKGKKIAGEDFIKTYGGKVEYIDLVDGISTSKIIDKILSAYSGE